MISWLGGTSEQGGNGFRSQEADNGGCSPWSPLLILSCLPGNLGPAAAHYTRNASLGQIPGAWWHINNPAAIGPGHLWVINIAHSNPSRTPWLPAHSDGSCQALRFPESGSVSACVCGCLGVGSLRGHGIWLVGPICIPPVPVLSVTVYIDLPNHSTQLGLYVWAEHHNIIIY